MFCRTDGEEICSSAEICISCGARPRRRINALK